MSITITMIIIAITTPLRHLHLSCSKESTNLYKSRWGTWSPAGTLPPSLVHFVSRSHEKSPTLWVGSETGSSSKVARCKQQFNFASGTTNNSLKLWCTKLHADLIWTDVAGKEGANQKEKLNAIRRLTALPGWQANYQPKTESQNSEAKFVCKIARQLAHKQIGHVVLSC